MVKKHIINKGVLILLTILICLCIGILIYKKFRTIYVKNYDSEKVVVYKLHKSVGFFSDLGFLAESYIRAKRVGCTFYVDSVDWSYTSKLGWHDYFSSLQEKPASLNNSNIIYCSHMNVASDIDGSGKMYLRDYESALKELFIINSDIQSSINNKKREFGNYEGLYIRRGDKIISGESGFQSTENIISQLQLSSELPIFVQTDDYTEVKNIKSLIKNKTIYSIVPETRHGANEKDRQTMTPEIKYDTMTEFLTGVSLCIAANRCYVDMMSNVSRFIKIMAPNTVSFYKLSNETPNYYSDKELTKNIAHYDSFL